MELPILEIDVISASDEELTKIFEYSDKIFREFEPDIQLPPLDLRIKATRQKETTSVTYRHYIADPEKDDMIVASTRISFSIPEDPGFEQNKKLTMISTSVLPEYRGLGFAKKLIKTALKKAVDRETVEQVIGGSDNELGHALCEHLEGKLVMSSAENRLRIEEIDWKLMGEWIEAGDKMVEKGDTNKLMFERCPDEIIEEFCEVYSETNNQQPTGGVEVDFAVSPETRRKQEEQNAELGVKWWTLISREKDGKISGLTELFYTKDMPWRLVQNLTGVKEEYRGKGLGKWLKADMLKFVKENEELNGVKYIVTQNATSNEAMLSINKRMGFKEHKSSNNYIFELKDLVKLLEM